MPPKKPTKSVAPKKINIALQGGGAHGAFTWGVLDAFLEDGRLDFEAISATSAGSVNAVAMLQGLTIDGNDGGRKMLEKFWRAVSEAGAVFSPVQQIAAENPFGDFFPRWASAENAAYPFFNVIAKNLSPYQFNPLDFNPLRDILGRLIDFKGLQQNCEAKLFLTATNVRTGDARVFTTPEITREVVLASAALPTVFQAVEIDGEAYWDGGFVGNPSLWPLYYDVESNDVMIVHVNPIVRSEIPRDAMTIEERLNEITFNSAMLKELRAIAFVQKLVKNNMLRADVKHNYREVLLHAVRAEHALTKLSLSSKFDTSWPFLTKLRDAGRKAAQDWMTAHFTDIGRISTVNIEHDYLDIKHHGG
jgi:NTE family protein